MSNRILQVKSTMVDNQIVLEVIGPEKPHIVALTGHSYLRVSDALALQALGYVLKCGNSLIKITHDKFHI